MIDKKFRKEVYRGLIKNIDKGTIDAELRIKVLKQIREGIRREFDRTEDTLKAINDQIEKLETKTDKESRDVLKSLKENRDRFQLDSDKLKEQMMGKLVKDRPDDPNCEAAYHGGLDEELKNIESNITGGEEFRKVVEEELKHL